MLIILLAYAAVGSALAFYVEPGVHAKSEGYIQAGKRASDVRAAYTLTLLAVAVTWPLVIAWALALWFRASRRVP